MVAQRIMFAEAVKTFSDAFIDEEGRFNNKEDRVTNEGYKKHLYEEMEIYAILENKVGNMSILEIQKNPTGPDIEKLGDLIEVYAGFADVSRRFVAFKENDLRNENAENTRTNKTNRKGKSQPNPRQKELREEIEKYKEYIQQYSEQASYLHGISIGVQGQVLQTILIDPVQREPIALLNTWYGERLRECLVEEPTQHLFNSIKDNEIRSVQCEKLEFVPQARNKQNQLLFKSGNAVYDHVLRYTVTLDDGEQLVVHAHFESTHSELKPKETSRCGELVACHFKKYDERDLGNSHKRKQLEKGVDINIYHKPANKATLKRLEDLAVKHQHSTQQTDGAKKRKTNKRR